MSLSREEVAGIAEYARIALTPAELDEMTAYMNEAVEMLDPIRRYDLEGVEPTYHPIGGLSNVMAPDVAGGEERALPLAAALQNAGSTQGRFFRVPSILGDRDVDRADDRGGDL
jgi:aspartyl-tRNA(Asn)/glutamyl-tRNA(Gln) amidotransferase subunit C